MQMPWNRPLPTVRPTDTLPLVAALEARVRALEERLAHISADSGLLRVEWSEVLDKISHWASRQSARDQKTAKTRLDQLAASTEAVGTANGEQPVSTAGLTGKAALRARLRARNQIGG